MSRIRFKSKQPPGIGGRMFGSLFFLVFFGMGALFCFFIGREFYLSAQMRSWTPTECVIVESQVSEDRTRSENPYKFVVRYDYQWQGRSFSSTKWSRQDGGFSDYSKAQRLVGIYPLDTRATCYVDSSNPQQAVLEKPSLWIGLVVLFPLIFVAVGLIGIVAMWRRSPPAGEPEVKAVSNRPLMAARSKKLGRRFAAIFFSFFLLIGSVVFYFLTLQPLLGVISARNWQPTPCTILSSQVQSHRGDSTTYSVDILYSYDVGGREFRSNRYKFMSGSSSGRKGKAEIVRRFPAGSQATCYVNLRNPADAVLERGFTGDMWFGLIPLVFVLVGAGGIIGSLRRQSLVENDASPYERLPMSRISGSNPSVRTFSELTGDLAAPRVLKSSSSRIGGVIAIGIFAAIWNGVIFFGFIRASGFFRRGHGDFFDWFGLLFMIPFVAVGLFLIGLLIYQILGLFNPKVELTLTPGTPELGGKISLSWRLSGRTQVLRGLKILVEAREEATYRRGTSTYTDRKPFFKTDLYTSASSMEPETGHAGVSLPEDSVPSWKSDNNRIVWAIRVVGDIPRWPDLKEEFVIEVRASRPKVSA